jgi:flagellar protein FliO/FliZ
MNLSISPLLAAVAQHGGENEPLDLAGSTASAHSAGGGSLVRTIVGLAIVLAVIFGLRWVLKQVKASREERGSGQGLSSMATLPLGSNRSLHVVRAGREVLVVGSGEHGVTPVRSYSEEEAQALGILEEATDSAGAAKAPGGPSAAAFSGIIGTLADISGRLLSPQGKEKTSATAKGALDTLRGWTVRG